LWDKLKLEDNARPSRFGQQRSSMMKLVSINVAQPREVNYKGKRVRSSIWKRPVAAQINKRLKPGASSK